MTINNFDSGFLSLNVDKMTYKINFNRENKRAEEEKEVIKWLDYYNLLPF